MYLSKLNEIDGNYKTEKSGLEQRLLDLKKSSSLLSKEKEPFEKERLILEKELGSIENKISSFQTEFDLKEKKEGKRYLIIGILIFFSYGFLDDKYWDQAIKYSVLLTCMYGLIIYRLHKKKHKTFNKEINVIKKKKHIKVDEIKKNSTILDPINEKLSDINSEMSDLSKRIDKLNLFSINSELLRETKSVLDKDDNLELDLIESTHMDKLIELNQVKIRKIEKLENKTYIPDLVKINLFLNNYQKGLVNDYNEIQSSVESLEYKNTLDIFNRDFNFYKILISNLIIMVDSIVNDNLIKYYKIREMFDKISIFESNYEKKLISELVGVRNVTRELIDVTYQSQQIISNQLESIDVSIQVATDEIGDINKLLLK